MRSPSPVRNQPLKSAHHTRFGPSACARGSRYGAVFRRCLRATTNPSRFSNSPIVLAAGHLRPAWSRSNTRFNFRGPQRMCACRNSKTSCSLSMACAPLYLALAIACSVRTAPGLICQASARSVPFVQRHPPRCCLVCRLKKVRTERGQKDDRWELGVWYMSSLEPDTLMQWQGDRVKLHNLAQSTDGG